jgi:hypothetical protein
MVMAMAISVLRVSDWLVFYVIQKKSIYKKQDVFRTMQNNFYSHTFIRI